MELNPQQEVAIPESKTPIIATFNFNSPVRTVAISPNGQDIAVGLENGTIEILIDQKWLSLNGHQSTVYSVAFSPDGTSIVSDGVDNTVRLWNLQGQPIGEPFLGHKNWVNSVAFSPDGKKIASSSGDKTVRLWNLQGQPIAEPFLGHESSVFFIAFSPDGKMIVSGSDDKTVRLWNLQGQPIGEPFLGHENGVISVAFSLDGETIVNSLIL